MVKEGQKRWCVDHFTNGIWGKADPVSGWNSEQVSLSTQWVVGMSITQRSLSAKGHYLRIEEYLKTVVAQVSHNGGELETHFCKPFLQLPTVRCFCRLHSSPHAVNELLSFYTSGPIKSTKLLYLLFSKLTFAFADKDMTKFLHAGFYMLVEYCWIMRSGLV